jgi:hypothetical protein
MSWNDDGVGSDANADNLEPDDKALQAARMEAQVWGRGPNGEGETPKATLRRLFEENSIAAAMQIIKLSTSASGERIRFDASKYLVDRVLGPVNFLKPGGSTEDHEPGSLEHTLLEMEKNIHGGNASGTGS